MDEYISKEFMLKNLEADKMNNAEHCEPVTVQVTVQIMERFIKYVKEFPSADVQPVNQWISVKDRLPDDCVEVLAYDTDCGVVIGWYDKEIGDFAADFISPLDAVTHWQPLPEPPKNGDA